MPSPVEDGQTDAEGAVVGAKQQLWDARKV